MTLRSADIASGVVEPATAMSFPAHSWYNRLNTPHQQQLAALARPRLLQAGEFLFHRGDAFCGIYGVCSGQLQISGLQQDGSEALLAFLFAGDWFGEIAFFDQQARTHDVRACQPTRLWQLPKTALQQLVQQDAQWWLLLGQLLTDKLRQTFLALEQQASFSAAERLAHRLWLWSAQQPLLQVSQEQLAQSLGISRQTCNQLLRPLLQTGCIRLHYRAVEVVDRAALALLFNVAAVRPR